MKLLVTSDWHLDVVTSGVARWDEIERAVDASVELAIAEKVDCYVMVGDVCNPDGWCVWRAVAKTIEVALRLSIVGGIESMWVAGNHDVVEDGQGTTMLTPVRELASAGVGGRVTVDEQPDLHIRGDVRLVTLPYTARSHTYDPRAYVRQLPAFTGRTLFLGHLCLEGITPGSETTEMPRGRDVFWPTKQIRKSIPGAVCVGGHYHKAQEYDGVHLVGSLARLTHGEEDNAPSYSVVEV